MTLDLEQLAEEMQREHRARQAFDVPRGGASHTTSPICAQCGELHQRFRDRAHTKPASLCCRCHAAYVRARRAFSRLTNEGVPTDE